MLYKYVKPERIDILENLNIVFTPFDELNDPFECQFVLNPIPEEELEAQNDENLAEWAQVQVWLEHRIGQLGMLCLTHTDQSLPMWAHYADNHQGFVLGFEEDNSFFKSDAYYIEPTLRTKQELPIPGFGTLREVEYVDERSVINLGDEVPWEFFFRKHKDWTYEKEVRIFRNRKDGAKLAGCRKSLVSLPSDVINSVIVGANASEVLEEKIIRALETNNLRHVELKRARLHRRKFEIVIEQLQNG